MLNSVSLLPFVLLPAWMAAGLLAETEAISSETHTPTSQIAPISRDVHPIAHPTISAFCADPVGAICRAASGRASRESNRERFRRSPLGQIANEPALAQLMTSLKPDGSHFPDTKSDAWWSTFEEFISTYFERIKSQGGDTTATFQGLRTMIRETAQLPGYFGPLPNERLERLSYISSRNDLQNIAPSRTKRLVLRALFEACYENGTTDNAVNVQYRYMAVCPNSLARALWKKREAGVTSSGGAWGLTKTIGHEIGHCIEHHLHATAYSEMESCLNRHHPSPGSDNSSLAAHEFRPYMDEIVSDYWGSHALARSVSQINEASRLPFLQAELEELCDQRGSQWEFTPLEPSGIITTELRKKINYRTHSHTGRGEPSHPRGEYRIQFISRQPFLRRALGCAPLSSTDTPACSFRGVSPPARY